MCNLSAHAPDYLFVPSFLQYKYARPAHFRGKLKLGKMSTIILFRKVLLAVCLLLFSSCDAITYSNSGCCICKKFSKEKIFFPSANFEHLFTAVFGTNSSDARSGFICRACCMSIKKWEKTKKTSQLVS